jgi:hypothetical protein
MAMTPWRTSNTYPTGYRDSGWHGNRPAASTETTPSGFPPAKAAGGLGSLLGQSTRRPRPDTSGEPLGKLLAEAMGWEYQPPKIGELEQLLGSDTFAHLMANPKIATAVG